MRESSPHENNEISAAELGHSLKRRWWLPVVGLVLGLLLSLTFSLSQETQYSSVTTALVQATSDEDNATDHLAAEELAKSRVATYQSLGNSVVVADAVKRDLNLKTSTAELLESVRVVGNPNSTDLEITAQATTPERAAELADAWRSALADVSAEPAPNDSIEVLPVGEPTVPERPAGISHLLIYAIGGAVGLLLGIVAAVAWGRPRNQGLAMAAETTSGAAAPSGVTDTPQPQVAHANPQEERTYDKQQLEQKQDSDTGENQPMASEATEIDPEDSVERDATDYESTETAERGTSEEVRADRDWPDFTDPDDHHRKV